MEDQKRCAGFLQSNLHVLPADSAPPSSLESFERRFFCGKAGRIMLRGYGAATVAVGALGSGEDTFSKTRRAQQHFANTRNFDNVYADGNDHGRNTHSTV